MGKLKQDVCVAEGDCLLFRATRGACMVENDCAAPARSRVTDSSGSRAERSHVVESAKLGKPPPAEPREARREGAGGAQRRATCFAEGGNHPPPSRETFRGHTALPPKSFRETRPARPAGGGTNDFRLSSLGEPAPSRHPELSVPGSRGEDSLNSNVQTPRATPAETPVSRFARALPERFLLSNPRVPGTEFFRLPPPRPLPGRTPFSRPRER